MCSLESSLVCYHEHFKTLENAGIIAHAHKLDLIVIYHLAQQSQDSTCSSRSYASIVVILRWYYVPLPFHSVALVVEARCWWSCLIAETVFVMPSNWVQPSCVLLNSENPGKHYLLQCFFSPKRLKRWMIYTSSQTKKSFLLGSNI